MWGACVDGGETSSAKALRWELATFSYVSCFESGVYGLGKISEQERNKCVSRPDSK